MLVKELATRFVQNSAVIYKTETGYNVSANYKGDLPSGNGGMRRIVTDVSHTVAVWVLGIINRDDGE